MPIVPNDRLGKIEFYEAHITPWTTNAVAIGLSAAQVTALGTLTTAARAAFNAAEVARQASKAATQNFYDKVAAMHSGPDAGSDLIERIKYQAESKNDPNIYNLAQIPPPAIPGPAPAPGTPFEFTVGLLQNGAVELKWKCNNPAGTQGTVYEVMRRVGSGTGPFTFVGATGIRSFTDDSIPSNGSPVTYQVTAVRSTSRGNPAVFTVSFGSGGAGFTVESLSNETTGVKIAA